MVDRELSTNAGSDQASEARRLAERGLHEQAAGNTECPSEDILNGWNRL